MNILVIHKRISYPLRGTLEDHLFSFYRYHGDNSVFYLRLDRQSAKKQKDKIPAYLKKIKFDVIVFHYGFTDTRTGEEVYWKESMEEVEYFRKSDALKVLFVQDEYAFTNRLNYFINYYGINLLYTLAPESEWRTIFDQVDFTKVKAVTTLTGYIDNKRFRKNERKYRKLERTIDVGYRARKPLPWYGRHGYRKGEIADVFKKALAPTSLVADISIEPQDTLYGNKWDEFLYRCKYMLGVESGVSVLDPDGSMFVNGNKYIKEHPGYTFEEVEARFFPGRDGKLKLFVISPRSFECCASRTCQVLVEGDYNNVLKPGVHYIPVAKDFSNVADVVKQMENDTLREKIVNAAYNDIIASGKYTYQKFIVDFFNTCQTNIPDNAIKESTLYYRVSAAYSFYADKWSFQAERLRLLRKKHLSKWFIIDLAKKMKRNSKLVDFLYRKLKNKPAFE